MWKHLDKYFNVVDLTIVYLIVSLLALNVKLFFIWTVVYLVCLGLVTRSWEKVVLYGFLPVSFYNIGQLYVFRIIEPWELNHPLYPDGRSIFFKLTPALLMSLALICSFLAKLLIKQVKSNWLINLLLVIVVIDGIRLYSDSILPWWVNLANYFSETAIIVWLWWTYNILKDGQTELARNFWKFLASFVKLTLIIGSVLVIAQGIKGSPIGLVVEQSSLFPVFGSGNDEIGIVSRPIGLMGSANEQAYDILVKIVAWLLIETVYGRNKKSQRWLLLPILAIIWLQSRSVYLGLLAVAAWWGRYVDLAQLQKIFFNKIGYGLTIMLILFGGVVLGIRFWGSVANLGYSNGVETRTKLIQVSERLIGHHFWMGVGKGNFIPIAFREDLTGFMKTFPESVHNGFVLIMVEQGFWGSLLWGEFLIFLVAKLLRSGFEVRTKLLFVAGLTAQFIVMMFQPFSQVLTMPVVIGMLLLTHDSA